MNALEDIKNPMVPDALGHVDAWRAWRVQLIKVPGGKPKLHLVALHSLRVWLPNATQALPCKQNRCPGTTVGEALTRSIDCRCGYHGWADEQQMREYMQVEMSEHDIAVIGGRVLLWGSVCEHKKGWRAEHAQAGEITTMRWNEKVSGLGEAQLRTEVLTELAARYEGLDVSRALNANETETDAQRERDELAKVANAPWRESQLRRLREHSLIFQLLFMALLLPPAFLHGHLLNTDQLTTPIHVLLLGIIVGLTVPFTFCSFETMRKLHRARVPRGS